MPKSAAFLSRVGVGGEVYKLVRYFYCRHPNRMLEPASSPPTFFAPTPNTHEKDHH